jgi:hypothetical protein
MQQCQATRWRSQIRRIRQAPASKSQCRTRKDRLKRAFTACHSRPLDFPNITTWYFHQGSSTCIGGNKHPARTEKTPSSNLRTGRTIKLGCRVEAWWLEEQSNLIILLLERLRSTVFVHLSFLAGTSRIKVPHEKL